VRRITLGLIGSVLAPGALAAQAPGLPVMNSGATRGVTVAALVGFPNDAAGGGTALQAGVTLGARRVAVGGFLARIGSPDGSADDVYSGGAAVTLKVLGGPLVPVAVNLQAGAAYAAQPIGTGGDKAKTWRVPVGLGISWTIPQPVVAIKPWIAPRLDYSRTDLPSGSLALGEGSRTDFGLSGGISFGFLNGLALDLAVDRVFRDGVGAKPLTFGAGVSFTFR
jgi:hypothetical protein